MYIRRIRFIPVSVVLLSCIFFTSKQPVFAQHIDIFGKLGKGKQGSYHQSFAPYSGTVQIPWIDEKPEPISIKVTETITYEIPVDKKKYNENKLTFQDMELTEVKDNTEINFHQVDCYYFNVVKQTQTRTVGNLTCRRERDGTQYWLSDGKKYVEWGKWSNWTVEEKETKNIEMAEKGS